MKKKFISIFLVIVMSLSTSAYAAAGFTDIPAGSWAEGYISQAVGLGIMNGYGDAVFGYGNSVTRAEFAAMLSRLFGWTSYMPETPTFNDTDKSVWYYGPVETAVKNGAVPANTAAFRPNDAITREEMAVMLVRALGYAPLAESLKNIKTPFTDVTENNAFIAMAYDFGIINGTSKVTFSPASSATREQAAAMMIRLYERYTAKTDWVHAFYAVNSYEQKELIGSLDAVSFGWSQLDFDPSAGASLNTSASGGNTHAIPTGYGEVVGLAKSGGVPDNLSVYMTASQKVTLPDGTVTNPCAAILLDDIQRTKAVSQIVSELQREGNFTGVTVDFEEMRGDALKNGLNQFLQELSTAIKPLGYALYVCVHPVTSDGIYFNAYDYKTIGSIADKVILMAHDYAAAALTAADMNNGFTTTPVSPIGEVFTALQAITDETTGVSDRSKIVLAVSFDSRQWKTVDGKVINAGAYHPDAAAIEERLLDPTAVLNYSLKYQNPYITYHNTTDNTDNIVWFEDARSIGAKASLARMFGITGLSMWRLGLIPAYSDPDGRQIYYDIPAWLEAGR